MSTEKFGQFLQACSKDPATSSVSASASVPPFPIDPDAHADSIECKSRSQDHVDESDTRKLLQWLCTFPVQRNHPRRKQVSAISGEVLTIHQSEKVYKAFQKLSREGVLGAPVVDAQHRFVGFVDMSNIVWYICHTFHAWCLEVQHLHLQTAMDKKIWTEFFKLERFREVGIDQVRNDQLQMQDQQNNPIPPFYPTYRGFSTFSAMEQMALLGSRRVAILDEKHRVVGLLTQSMVISLLDQNMQLLGNMKDIQVADIVAGWTEAAQCISEQTLAIHAFKALATKNVSGIGVVNAAGCLVDMISINDLVAIGSTLEHFERLWSTVKEYKECIRKEFSHSNAAVTPSTVTLSSTLETVIKQMHDGSVHRVFVVKEEAGSGKGMNPLYVITQRDVIKTVLLHCGLKSMFKGSV